MLPGRPAKRGEQLIIVAGGGCEQAASRSPPRAARMRSTRASIEVDRPRAAARRRHPRRVDQQAVRDVHHRVSMRRERLSGVEPRARAAVALDQRPVARSPRGAARARRRHRRSCRPPTGRRRAGRRSGREPRSPARPIAVRPSTRGAPDGERWCRRRAAGGRSSRRRLRRRDERRVPAAVAESVAEQHADAAGAPLAARSERLTATSFQATSPGGSPGR